MSQITRIKGSQRAASLVIAGADVTTSGLVATAEDAVDIRTQTRSVLSQAEALFSQAGLGKADITRVQIWLADMADFPAMNEIYDAWVDPEHAPVRACVGAALANKHYLIEIQVYGYRPD